MYEVLTTQYLICEQIEFIGLPKRFINMVKYEGDRHTLKRGKEVEN